LTPGLGNLAGSAQNQGVASAQATGNCASTAMATLSDNSSAMLNTNTITVQNGVVRLNGTVVKLNRNTATATGNDGSNITITKNADGTFTIQIAAGCSNQNATTSTTAASF
jgi:hypothetical protein